MSFVNRMGASGVQEVDDGKGKVKVEGEGESGQAEVKVEEGEKKSGDGDKMDVDGDAARIGDVKTEAVAAEGEAKEGSAPAPATSAPASTSPPATAAAPSTTPPVDAAPATSQPPSTSPPTTARPNVTGDSATPDGPDLNADPAHADAFDDLGISFSDDAAAFLTGDVDGLDVKPDLDALAGFDGPDLPPPPPPKPSVHLEHVDVDLGPLKSVSRNHAKIEYRSDCGQFCLEIFGRNGAWVDDRYYVKGTVVPLNQG